MPEIPTTSMRTGPIDDPAPLVARARALAPSLPSYRAAHDHHKQLSPPVVNALRDNGFPTCLAPRQLGGHEVSVPEYIELLEALALGDSATAWCTMTASTAALVATYLPRKSGEELWRDVPPFLAGVFDPEGQLTAEGDDFRLTGRWSYASGSRHADWFVVGAMFENRHRVCFLPASQVTVLDNWNTLGLAGTGSHDLVIEGALVPGHRVTSLFERAPWSDAALYRVPLFGVLAAGIAACALGIAGAALERAATDIVAAAPPNSSSTGPGPSSGVLVRYATCRAQLDAARAYLLAAATASQARANEGAVDPATRAELRLAASFVSQQCAEVARGAFHLCGSAAARTDHPIGNALRDLETLLTHKMVTDRALPAAARVMLGLGKVPPDL
jgi:indole-3-acetate monooxygenase